MEVCPISAVMKLIKIIDNYFFYVQITVDNFNEKLPEVFDAVDNATFVAIDGEFSGIHDDVNRYAAINHKI